MALVLLALVLLELSGNVPRWTRPPQTAALGIAAALRAGRSVVLPSVKLVCKAEPVAGLSLRCVQWLQQGVDRGPPAWMQSQVGLNAKGWTVWDMAKIVGRVCASPAAPFAGRPSAAHIPFILSSCPHIVCSDKASTKGGEFVPGRRAPHPAHGGASKHTEGMCMVASSSLISPAGPWAPARSGDMERERPIGSVGPTAQASACPCRLIAPYQLKILAAQAML